MDKYLFISYYLEIIYQYYKYNKKEIKYYDIKL